ncbi:MAG: hypothetical protein MI702_13760 [Chlorobiales bacterium]|nr:hypothetical protein [Chlorobiales bacterium]
MIFWSNRDSCGDSKMTKSHNVFDVIDYDIIEENERKEIRLSLDLWAKCHYTLENRFMRTRQGFLVRDFVFIKILGKSVYHLNVANSLIINSFKRFLNHEIDNSENKDNPNWKSAIKDFEALERYMRFHNNLIASKVKYYCFRETPMPSINYPYMDINKDVISSGLSVLKALLSKKIDISNLCGMVSKYYYSQDLIYSFIFNEDKEYGAFINFKYSSRIFTDLKERINGYMGGLLIERGLIGIKLFVAKLSCGIMDYYVNEKKNVNYEKIINKPSCYNEFCEAIRGNDKFVEPLTFRLIDILWKINGILSMAKKSTINDEDSASFNDKCNVQIKKFIDDYLKVTEELYDKGTIDYYKLYCIEQKLFEKNDNYDEQGLYSLIFSEYSVKSVRDRLKKQSLIDGKDKGITIETACNSCESNDAKINALSKDNESGLKMMKLLQDMFVPDIMSLMCSYAHMVKLNRPDKLDEEYVGFYKSGVFLAHMVNVILKQRKYVWLFCTRPYVATLPIHREDDCYNIDRVILFDESLKTGFTYTLYESYIMRNLSDCGIKVSLYTIFDFSYYKRIADTSKLLFESVFNVNEKLKVSKKEYFQKSHDPENLDKISFTYKGIDEIIESIRAESGEIDLFYLMSDTDSILSVCKDFCDIICRESGDKQKIALFSASESGDVLTMFVALMLKIEKKDIVFIEKSNIKRVLNEKAYVVFIDMTITSGFSADYTWRIMNEKKYSAYNDNARVIMEKIGNEEIDLLLSIYSAKDVKSEKVHVLYPQKNNSE